MKEELTIEGIVLRSVPVQEGKRILTAFTPGEGLVSMATPRAYTHEMRLASATALLSRSEFCCRKGNSDVFRLREACLIESFDSLRSQYANLSAAGELLHAILNSQLAGRPAPLLYELILSYLRRLTTTQNPLLLAVSFKLKLLKHEGLFAWTHEISPTVQEFVYFSHDEWVQIGLLACSRSFSEIESISTSSSLAEKISSFFEKLLR